MQQNLINYGLAFLEGFALILSPCILPILPIMLSGSIEGGRKRPLGIIIGFVFIFALFTLFARSIVQLLGIDLDKVRDVAFIFIILFGIILVSDKLSLMFSQFTQFLANFGNKASQKIRSDGFISGLILGGLISLIWVPCAGPILAAAIVQTAIQKTTLATFFTFLCFALGSVIPMLIIALVGRTIVSKTKFLKKHSEKIRKIFGVIIIIAAFIAIFMPMETAPAIENMPTELSDKTPQATHESQMTSNKEVAQPQSSKIISGVWKPYTAPDLEENSTWFNSSPLNMNKLRGKVVLIDFWTYSCINCIRTLPFLKQWYAKYHKDGLEIIGVHTPEFEFEKKPENVKDAIARFGIQYPVVQDNDYITWIKYKNQYWPAHYLIDKNGQVVYEHFGEGDYIDTEKNIQSLLGLSEKIVMPENPTNFSLLQSPETYLGYEKASNFQSKESMVHDQKSSYHYSQYLSKDGWDLQGEWRIEAEKIISEASNASIKYNFYAGSVFVVMGSNDGKSKQVVVLLDGQPIQNGAGKDLVNGILTVTDHRLYEVVHWGEAKAGMLELVSKEEGLEVYTFTFGS